MNAPLVISPDTIRRFPFAVNPARMTADIEQLIANDMAQRCRDEGHIRRLPMGVQKQNCAAREKIEAIQNTIVKLLRDGEPRSVTQISIFLATTTYDVRAACLGLLELGVIVRAHGDGKSRSTTIYQHASAARIRAHSVKWRRKIAPTLPTPSGGAKSGVSA